MTSTIACECCGTADPPIVKQAWASGGGVRHGYGMACSACNRAAVTISIAHGSRAAHERVHGPCLTDVPRLEAHQRARAAHKEIPCDMQ